MISTTYFAKLRNERRATCATSRSVDGRPRTIEKLCFAIRRFAVHATYPISPSATAKA